MSERYSGLSAVRRRNRRNIRSLLYRRAPVTRTELAEALGLTLPTVTTSVSQMLEEGLLLEEPSPEAGGGRRPNLLRFNPSAEYALGVELGPYETAAGLYDLAGEPVAREIFPTAPSGYEEMLDSLQRQLEPLAAKAPGRLLGIGIGTPGFVNREQGVIRASSRAGWNGRPVAADVGSRLGLPALADNNVRMRALGQELFAGSGLPDLFAYLFVSKGIACPLIIRDELLSGSTSGAGELGHMVIQPDGPVCPTCGSRGCLESVAGETAVLRDCRELLRAGKAPVLRQLAGDAPDIRQILAAQQAGDPDVRRVIDRAVEYLGFAVAGVVNLISPAQVLIEGYLFRIPENRERLLSAARAHFYGLNAREVAIRFLPFDHFGGAKGAAAAVIETFCIEAE